MWQLFISSLKMLYRNKQALLWAVFFPILFVVVFGLFNFDTPPEVKVAIAGPADSPVTQALREGFGHVDSFTVSRPSSVAAGEQRLSDDEVDVLVVVPSVLPDRGKSVSLGVEYKAGNTQTNQVALAVIRQTIDGMNMRFLGVSSPPLVMRPQPVAGKHVSYLDFLLPGLVAMGVMNFSITGVAIALAKYREQRILKRILATPLRPVRFLTAEVLARCILALVQASLIVAVGVFGFGAHIYGSIPWMFALVLVANLIFLNIGAAVAGRAPNTDAAAGIANVVALPMMFLSGVFFSSDMLPKAVYAVTKWLPLSPLITAMRKIAVDAAPITAIGPQLALLGAWLVASFALAAWAFRFAGGRT